MATMACIPSHRRRTMVVAGRQTQSMAVGLHRRPLGSSIDRNRTLEALHRNTLGTSRGLVAEEEDTVIGITTPK